MDRCAIFVDAGYLYAAGGWLCCSTRARSDFDLDAKAFNEMAVTLARGLCSSAVLRTYWYDGAKKGIPSAQQQRIAGLANVKLRLGRLNSQNEQKGVDALIYRDLMTLASERAVTDAFLVSGDEDLREGVKAAQDRGVRVVLIGVAAVAGYNQSRELVEEVDDVITLTKSDLSPIFTPRVPPAAPTQGRAVPATQGPLQLPPTPDEAGRLYAGEWLKNATGEDIRGLIAAFPRIPRTLDVELLQSAETTCGRSLRGDDRAHRATRKAFWDIVKKAPMS